MSKNTQYVTVQYLSGGPSNPGIVSEQVFVTVDTTDGGVTGTEYSLTAVASVAQTTTSSIQAFLTFYSASGSSLAVVNATPQTNPAAGTVYTLTTAPKVAPVTTSYVIATIQLSGTPSPAALLEVYSGIVSNTNNAAMAAYLNRNFSFLTGLSPWQAANGANVQWISSPLTVADGGVYDSLVIDDSIELIGAPGGTQSNLNTLIDPATGQGAIFRIAAPGGNISFQPGTVGPYDLGEPQPTTDVVESMLLDGERPYGRRSSNRTIIIPVAIFAKSLKTMAAAREYLLSIIDKDQFKITWTAGYNGLPMVLDCFRAQPSVTTYGFNYNRGPERGDANWAITLVNITIPALPFGKSGIDGVQSRVFQNGLVDGPSYNAAVMLDNYSTVNDMTPYTDQGQTYVTGGWRANTSKKPDGGSQVNAAEYLPPSPPTSPWPRAIYSKTGLSVNAANMSQLVMWFGQSFDTQWAKDPKFVSNVRMNWTLTDNNGKTLVFDGPVAGKKIPWGASAATPVWTQVSANIPQNVAGFNYSNIAGYKVVIANYNTAVGYAGYSSAGHDAYMKMKAWLYGLTFQPSTIANTSTARSSVYQVQGTSGMARSPVNTEIQLPSQIPTSQEITQSGTWLVPNGVYTVQAEAWGGGGAGSSVASNLSGGGGGGAEYAAETSVSVIPGTKVPVAIGAGGTGAQLAPTTVNFTAAGAHTWTPPAGVTQISVSCWGGGAAGAAGGGGGGGGKYAGNTALTVSPGTPYYINVGLGGKPNTGTSSAQTAARNGGVSWFNGRNTVPVGGVDTGMPAAQGGSSPATGSSTGGAGASGGSPGPVNHNGGNGGKSPGQAGGGGGSAGGPSNPGGNGGDSPAAGSLGKYKNGGVGAGGGALGGGGGTGASAPGTPTAGAQPGGGGGGGYTGSTGGNYLGASGGNGEVSITYQVALGAAVNGAATTFGQSGLTNTNVVANGGLSAAANTAVGAAGGSGSSNNIHFNGGAGGGGTTGTGGTDLNELLLGYNMTLFTDLAHASLSGTNTTFTSAASSAAFAKGNAAFVYVLVPAGSNVAGVAPTDSAGNVYSLVASAPGVGVGDLYVYSTTLLNAITTSTTLTLATFQTAITAPVIWWQASQYFGATSILSQYVASATGTSSAPAVSYTNPLPGTPVFEVMLDIFGSADTLTQQTLDTGWIPSANTGWTDSASHKWSQYGKMVGGSSSAISASATLSGGAVLWGRIAIPFVPLNQETASVWIGRGSITSAATTTTVTSQVNAQIPVDAGSGMMFVVVTAPAAGTPVVTDTAGNTYTKQFTSASSGGVTTVFTSPITAAILATNVITVTDGTSQTRFTRAFYMPNVTAYDASADTSATGTGTAVSGTVLAPSTPNEYVFAIAHNNSSSNYTIPTGWTPTSETSILGGGQTIQAAMFFKKQLGTTPLTFSSTQSPNSGAWTVTLGSVQLITGANSGGGGSAAGPTGAGLPAVGATGGAGTSGGGVGAAGVTGVDADGNAAGLPGGGGSGANSGDVTPNQGGSGGRGMVRLTWTPPLRTFNDMIVHRPSEDSKAKNLNPVVQVAPADPPDNREYPVASTVSGANAQFGATYSVLLINHSWDSPTVSRKVAVTVNQYEYLNGPVVSVQATKNFTPATDIINGYITVGELTLPIKDYASDAAEVYYTVSVHDTNGNDRFQDVIFLDTLGQTVLVNIAPGTAGDGRYNTYYIDEPGTDADLGQLLGTGYKRDRAISVFDMAFQTGGPIYIDDALNSLLVYSTSGAPNLGLSYLPRWYSDRLS